MSLAPGTKLGPYEIVSPLGAGGMGEVYRARDTRLGRDVAVKVLPSAFAQDAERQHRFEQEARAVAALSHPNILTVHDVGRENGVSYLVTELLDGRSLRERLAAGPVSIGELLEIILQLASGLAAAHGRGIVHRDLKPENVFLTRDHVVKILDFGLAKMTPAPGTDADVTRVETSPGFALGTIGYMAPEQVRGQSVDARADVFALGAIFYEAVAGRRPFDGPSPADTMSAILTSKPPALMSRTGPIPSGVERIVDRCLAKRPGDRFQSAHDLRFAVETLKSTLSGVTPAPADAAPSIAVLPFTDMSPAQDQAYFCEGMAEEVINALTRIEGLRVAARTSTFQFKARGHDVKQIAQALDVSSVLEGSVRTSGQRLRVGAQLVEAQTGRAIWSDRYDGEMADVFDIQDRIASSIVAALKVRLLGGQTAAAPDRGTDNLEAYQQYLRGRHHRFSTYRLKDALAAFEEAVRLDESYVLAHVGLAYTVMVLGNWGYLPPDVAYARAQTALDRMLAVAPDHPAVMTVQAYLIISFERRFEDGWRLFDQAIAKNPHDPEPYIFRAILRGAAGDATGVQADYERALQIDPFSAWLFAATSLAFLGLDHASRALELARRAIEIRPDAILGYFVAGSAASLLEDHDEAIRMLERGAELSQRPPWMLSALGSAYGRAGRLAEANAVLNTIDERAAREYVNPSWRAVVLSAIGREDEALDRLESLEKTFNSNLTYLRMPLWTGLRKHPRFHALVSRVGLKPLT